MAVGGTPSPPGMLAGHDRGDTPGHARRTGPSWSYMVASPFSMAVEQCSLSALALVAFFFKGEPYNKLATVIVTIFGEPFIGAGAAVGSDG